MEQQETNIKEKDRTDLRIPKMYQVLLHNDDFTTFEFVIQILVSIFFKTRIEAEALAETVHKSGQAVVGIYSLDVAASKVRKATQMARKSGFPLRINYTPVE